MSRKSKNINYSEIFQNIDNGISVILDKCSGGKTFNTIEEYERKTFWSALFNVIKKEKVTEMEEENTANFKKCIELILYILNSNNVDLECNYVLVDIIIYLNNEFLNEENDLIDSVSKLNEYWMVKMRNPKEISGMEYLTLKHLLKLCTNEKLLVSDIQRLSAIRKFISSNPFDKAVPSLRPLLIKLVQFLPVTSSEHGQRFIAQSLVLSQKVMTEIHRTIVQDLRSCNKKKAEYYGRIYVMAWNGASNEMKKILEHTCFQHLMETFLKEHRTSLELSKNSQNILGVLEVWHSERKKKAPDFITMITNAYQPILWKYLQSGFNVHRCNAADLFFKAFPLQRSDDSAADAENFFNLQFETMMSSLTDDCHIVRIIAIREICNILSHYWNSFTPVQIQNLISVITKQCASDASSAEVRRMVYIGFQSLVKSSLSSDYVKQILPNLSNNIHDVNQRVRTAFIQLLICIKEKRDPNFKYSDVVSMSHIQYRLAKDNIGVGHWIVKLLMRNYYHSKMSVIEWTKRFIYLIKTYRASYRNFFFFSSKSLPFEDACTIIYEILSQLGAFVLNKSCIGQDNSENVLEKTKGKRKESKITPLSDWNRNQKSSEMDNSDLKKCAFDDPDVIMGLFDIVTILWVLHDNKLHDPENEEMRFKLYGTYIKYAQPFINYYKDCNLLYAIICLSGNIPASLLRNNSITLPGYCMKMLKSIKMDNTDEENDKIGTVLAALIKWSRGGEILEQVGLWLDAAFETQNMNETILPRRRVKINETIQPNSIIAIYILDTLLKKEYIKLSILKKNYKELFHLWKFMSRVKQLIEARLEQGEPFEEDLVSDQFITLCFRRYVKLIPLFKESGKCEEDKENASKDEVGEDYINYQKEMDNIYKWSENLLYPLLQQEEIDEVDVALIVSCIEDILYVSDNLIIVHLVNSSFHFQVGHFVLKLLNTKYGARFIKASTRIAAALSYSAKLLFKVNDNLRMFSTVVPSLLSHSLNVLTNPKLSPKDIEKLEKDMPHIRTNLGKVLATYQENLKSKFNIVENARQLKLVVVFFLDCITSILCQEIPREDSVPIFASISQLPPMAEALLTLFYNKKTWTPLFIHVMNTRFDTYDAKSILACTILLHLYASTEKKLGEANIRKALITAKKSLNKIKESKYKSKDDFEPFMDTDTTTKKTWASDAATRGHSTSFTGFLPKPTEPVESLSEVVTDKETDKCHDTEKFKTALSFQKEGNLEVDVINCGLDLIKNIENILENNEHEAED